MENIYYDFKSALDCVDGHVLIVGAGNTGKQEFISELRSKCNLHNYFDFSNTPLCDDSVSSQQFYNGKNKNIVINCVDFKLLGEDFISFLSISRGCGKRAIMFSEFPPMDKGIINQLSLFVYLGKDESKNGQIRMRMEGRICKLTISG
ncbi:hypothetical protein QMI71_004441 [Salmonella enterica]|nr:hypothetical protein [Salmonella enterica]